MQKELDEERNFLTVLEEELRADATGTRKKQVEAELYETLTAVRQQMDSGLPPGEFEQLATLRIGLEAGLTTLDKAWGSFHPAR